MDITIFDEVNIIRTPLFNDENKYVSLFQTFWIDPDGYAILDLEELEDYYYNHKKKCFMGRKYDYDSRFFPIYIWKGSNFQKLILEKKWFNFEEHEREIDTLFCEILGCLHQTSNCISFEYTRYSKEIIGFCKKCGEPIFSKQAYYENRCDEAICEECAETELIYDSEFEFYVEEEEWIPYEYRTSDWYDNVIFDTDRGYYYVSKNKH